MSRFIFERLAVWLVLLWNLNGCHSRVPVTRRNPEKIVVLTFDDAIRSQAEIVAPMLKKYGFGGTFFICEFPPDFNDKSKYLTWAQIRELDRMGFEIGNHTLTHRHVNKLTDAQFAAELNSIEARCRTYGIRRPETFAYPGYDTSSTALAVLRRKGYHFARVGGARPYNPAKDDPLLVPSFSTTGTDTARVLGALRQAAPGKIVVLTIHGVPDYAHAWVNTPPEVFEQYLKFLHEQRYTVIALRDLPNYLPRSSQQP